MSTQSTIAEAGRIREAARTEFVRLARCVASGEDVTPEEINRVASESGREIAEFGPLVLSLKTRAQLRLQAAARMEIETELATIEETLNRESAICTEAIDKFNRTVYPIGERRKVLQREVAQIRCVPSDLANTCPDPALNAEAKRLRNEAANLQQQYRDAAGEVERLQGQLNQLDPSHDQHGRFVRAIERAKATIADIANRIEKNTAASEANFQARIQF